jgi:hypothetical protein
MQMDSHDESSDVGSRSDDSTSYHSIESQSDSEKVVHKEVFDQNRAKLQEAVEQTQVPVLKIKPQ